eukprot:comp15167_c0_seq1/m.22723 comp15167_c0_seq1/g.22723  ORF comp15167_c0_seq1/g.22723 comp15167_c0_seq1/m.22723 type:complete len:314 (-) comp15167_c0_seq1:111-1052(-)
MLSPDDDVPANVARCWDLSAAISARAPSSSLSETLCLTTSALFSARNVSSSCCTELTELWSSTTLLFASLLASLYSATSLPCAAISFCARSAAVTASCFMSRSAVIWFSRSRASLAQRASVSASLPLTTLSSLSVSLSLPAIDSSLTFFSPLTSSSIVLSAVFSSLRRFTSRSSAVHFCSMTPLCICSGRSFARSSSTSRSISFLSRVRSASRVFFARRSSSSRTTSLSRWPRRTRASRRLSFVEPSSLRSCETCAACSDTRALSWEAVVMTDSYFAVMSLSFSSVTACSAVLCDNFSLREIYFRSSAASTCW